MSPDKAIEVEAIEVEALGGGEHPHEPDLPLAANGPPAPHTATSLYTGGAWRDAQIFLRESLQPGHRVRGPALIIELHQTVVVEPNWQSEVTRKNHLLLTSTGQCEARTAPDTTPDPVLLEVFNKLFTAIAEQMGYALQNTARSVNIKERLDFSCAIFDSAGSWSRMPRISPCIWAPWTGAWRRCCARWAWASSPATSGCLNAPYNGGTHLPDITVVTPVFAAGSTDFFSS